MRVWAAIKLMFLYLSYWFVGLDEEGFQISKGSLLIQMKFYSAAAKSFQRALKETDAAYVHSSLGYCYLCMGIYDKSIKSLNIAYGRKPDIDVAIWLTYAYHHNGNMEECKKLFQTLLGSEETKSQEILSEIRNIEAMLKEPQFQESDTISRVEKA